MLNYDNDRPLRSIMIVERVNPRQSENGDKLNQWLETNSRKINVVQVIQSSASFEVQYTTVTTLVLFQDK